MKYKETFPGSGEWIKVPGPKAEKKQRAKAEPIDWDKVLTICQQCEEYIQPNKEHAKGICDPAIDANHGSACGGCFKWFVRKCEKQNMS